MGALAVRLGRLALGLLAGIFLLIFAHAPTAAFPVAAALYGGAVFAALVGLPVAAIGALRRERGSAAGLAMSLLALLIAVAMLLLVLALRETFKSPSGLLG